MKTLKNEKFEYFKIGKNADYKEAIMYQLGKDPAKNFSSEMIRQRIKLIDKVEDCKKDIELEDADWKTIQTVFKKGTWIDGQDIPIPVLREINKLLEQIEKIL